MTSILKNTTISINGNSIPSSQKLLKSYLHVNDQFIRTNSYNDFNAMANLEEAIENNNMQCSLIEIAIYSDDIDISQQDIDEYFKSIGDK